MRNNSTSSIVFKTPDGCPVNHHSSHIHDYLTPLYCPNSMNCGKKINTLVSDGNVSLILPRGLAVTQNGTVLVCICGPLNQWKYMYVHVDWLSTGPVQ